VLEGNADVGVFAHGSGNDRKLASFAHSSIMSGRSRVDLARRSSFNTMTVSLLRS
jgi:hypothetical protein